MPLLAATYFMVSGGPYGLEEIIGDAGYGWALIILFVLPFFWSLPTSLMIGELAAAVPEEGGFYAWVRRAMGPFWGFQEAWLSLRRNHDLLRVHAGVRPGERSCCDLLLGA